MARQLRIEYEGALYHVTSRGNLRERVFFEDRDKERFLAILARTKERYGYLLHAYVLMDNHYHLLLETPKANLSQIMQNINTSYTVYVNRKYQRNGHLFQGRFKGIIVDKDEYLVALSRYIHLNPVRAKVVQRPEDFRWASYRTYIGQGEKEALVDAAETLRYFSEHKDKASKAYKEYVEGGMEKKESPLKAVEAGTLLGGERFKEKVRGFLNMIKADEELPQLNRLRGTVPIERIVNVCCDHYSRDNEEVLKRGKDKEERQIAVYLSKMFSGESNREIGNYFGIKGPAVSGAVKAIEERVNKECMLRKDIELLKERLINEK